MLGGNSADIRADAARVRSWADQTEDDAATALAADQVDWESTAADRWRDDLVDRRAEVTDTAQEIRAAAALIDQLADTLESRQSDLQALLDQAGKTMDDVADALANGASDAFDVAQGFASDALEAAGNVLDAGVDGARGLGNKIRGLL